MTRSTNHASRILAFILLTFVGCQPAVGEINTHVDHVVYDGNGSTKTFSFSFAIFSTAHLSVVCRDTTTGVEDAQTLNSDYTMTDDDGDGDYTDGPGGSVTFVTAPASGTQVWLMRVPPLTQTTNLDGTTYVRLTTLEDCVDKIVCQIQYLQGQLYRVPMIPATERQVSDVNLPNSGGRAEGYLGFDSAGDIRIVATAIPDANVSPFWNTTIAEDNLGDSLSSLGIGTAAGNLALRERYEPNCLWVTDYGATGDGSTDVATAFQTAENDADDMAGRIFLPPGTYALGSTVTVSASMEIVGAGPGTVVHLDAAVPAFTLSGAAACVTFRNITFDGQSVGRAIYVSASLALLRIVDCNFVNCSGGDTIASAGSLTQGRIEIVRCHFQDCQDGIYFPDKYGSVLIDACVIDTLTETGAVHGVHLGYNTAADFDEMTDAVVSNCVFRDITTTGVNSETHAVMVYGERGAISGNKIDTITNNASSTAGAEAIYMKCSDGQIVNNVIVDGGRSTNGAICTKTTAGSCYVAGNEITESATTSEIGIYIDGDGARVYNNMIHDLSGYGISVGTSDSQDNNDIYLVGNQIINHKGYAGVFMETNTGKNCRITDNIISGLLATDGTISNVYGIIVAPEDGDFNDIEIARNTISDDDTTSATTSVRAIYVSAADAASRILGLGIHDNTIAVQNTTIDVYGTYLAVPSTESTAITNLSVYNNNTSTMSGHDTAGTIPFYVSAADAAQCTVARFDSNTFRKPEDLEPGPYSNVVDVNSISADITNFDTGGVHIIDSSGAAISGALADGAIVGQTVRFVCKTAGNNIDISVSHHVTSDPEVIRLDTAKEWVELVWDGTDWVETSGNGQTYP